MYVDGNVDERCMERDFLESDARASRTRSEHNNYMKQAGGLPFFLSFFFSHDKKYSIRVHSSEAVMNWPLHSGAAFVVSRARRPRARGGSHDSTILIMRQSGNVTHVRFVRDCDVRRRK